MDNPKPLEMNAFGYDKVEEQGSRIASALANLAEPTWDPFLVGSGNWKKYTCTRAKVWAYDRNADLAKACRDRLEAVIWAEGRNARIFEYATEESIVQVLRSMS